MAVINPFFEGAFRRNEKQRLFIVDRSCLLTMLVNKIQFWFLSCPIVAINSCKQSKSSFGLSCFRQKCRKVILSANRNSINWQSIQKKNNLFALLFSIEFFAEFSTPCIIPKSPRLILTGVRFFYVPERASTFSSSRFQKFCV